MSFVACATSSRAPPHSFIRRVRFACRWHLRLTRLPGGEFGTSPSHRQRKCTRASDWIKGKNTVPRVITALSGGRQTIPCRSVSPDDPTAVHNAPLEVVRGVGPRRSKGWADDPSLAFSINPTVSPRPALAFPPATRRPPVSSSRATDGRSHGAGRAVVGARHLGHGYRHICRRDGDRVFAMVAVDQGSAERMKSGIEASASRPADPQPNTANAGGRHGFFAEFAVTSHLPRLGCPRNDRDPEACRHPGGRCRRL